MNNKSLLFDTFALNAGEDCKEEQKTMFFMRSTWFSNQDRKITFNMSNNDSPQNYDKFNDNKTNYLLYKGKDNQDELYIEEKSI